MDLEMKYQQVMCGHDAGGGFCEGGYHVHCYRILKQEFGIG